jgi:hypothetical protein
MQKFIQDVIPKNWPKTPGNSRKPKRHHHRGAEIRKNEPELYIKMDIYGDAIGEEVKKAGAMQLVGCDRIHEEITRNRPGATTPREKMPKRCIKAAEAQRGMHLIRKPAKLTGARHELCTWGEPTRPGVGSLRRKRYTQYVEHNWTGHYGNKSEN